MTAKIKIKERRGSIDKGSRITEEIRPKKLKLSLRHSSFSSLIDDLRKFQQEPDRASSILNQIAAFYPLNNRDCEKFFDTCVANFENYAPLIRKRILELSTDFIERNCLEKSRLQKIADSLINSLCCGALNDECTISVLHILYVAASLDATLTFADDFYVTLKGLLESTCWQIRKWGLNLFTCSMINQDKIENRQNLENVLMRFLEDCDSRVRLIAADNLILINEKAWKLDAKLYPSLCQILDDDCPTVRLQGLRLIKSISETYPEVLVPGPNKNTDIRLADDTFSRLCNSMHDISVEVRTESAKLLGSMKSVSEKFLEQTLDKKLMSHMQFLKNCEQQKFSAISEWATGRKYGEDAAVEKLDEDLAALIPSGACGAFVTGLEDEYLAVRSASVDAVCRLAEQSSSSFANKALDFLADMFNDEIEEVRLNAIRSLRQLCRRLVLKELQMDTILNALDDASSDSREALRELLSICTLHSVVCLKMTVEALINNLKRYPQDKVLIWNCMKNVGYNHPNLVQPLVVELLGYHEFFDLPEPSIDDSFYISKLLLVLNAAANCPTIKSLLLPFTWRHYEYLRNSNPHLTPSLETYIIESDNNKSDQLIESLNLHTMKTISLAMQATGVAKWELLKLTLNHTFGSLVKGMVSGLRITSWPEIPRKFLSSICPNRKLWQISVFINLERLCTFSQENNSKWTFSRLYCSILLEFHQTLASYKNLSPSDIISDDHLFVQKLKQLLFDTFKLGLLWNVGEEVAKFIYALRFRIAVEFLKLKPEENKILYDKTMSEMEKKCKGFVDLCKTPDDPASVKDWAEDFLNSTPKLDDIRKEKTATVLEPDRNSERILRFHADLIACISFTCILRNFDESEFVNLRIRVTYPNQRTTLQRISVSNCVKKISDHTHRLRGEAFVADNVWSDASSVEISLVHILPDEYCKIWKNNSHFIDLVEPVTCKVYPKAKC